MNCFNIRPLTLLTFLLFISVFLPVINPCYSNIYSNVTTINWNPYHRPIADKVALTEMMFKMHDCGIMAVAFRMYNSNSSSSGPKSKCTHQIQQIKYSVSTQSGCTAHRAFCRPICLNFTQTTFSKYKRNSWSVRDDTTWRICQEF